MPIYAVKLAGDVPVIMVKAKNAAAARHHVLHPIVIKIEALTAEAAMTLAGDGVKLECATTK